MNDQDHRLPAWGPDDAPTSTPGGGLHVLLLPSSFPSVASPLAGLFAWNQARALRALGVRVGAVYPDRRSLRSLSLAACRGQHGQVSGAIEDGISTIRWQGWNVPHRVASGRLFRAVAHRLVDRYVRAHGRPDLIHAHGALWAGAAAAGVTGRLGLPYVVTEHSSAFLLDAVHGPEAAWARRAFARSELVIAVSRALADGLGPFVADPGSVRVVGNVVDTDFFGLPDVPRTLGGGARLLCIAQLQPAKGVDVLLRSFARAVGAHKAMVLEIGGGNRGWEPLRALAADLGIADRVAFLGPLTRAEVRDALWRADALVVPSHVETFGVVAAEALATGLPVIATRSGGPEDIIEDGLGRLVPVGDEVALAEAMTALDPPSEHRAELAERRRASIVPRFSPDAIGHRLVDVYQEVLRGPRP